MPADRAAWIDAATLKDGGKGLCTHQCQKAAERRANKQQRPLQGSQPKQSVRAFHGRLLKNLYISIAAKLALGCSVGATHLMNLAQASQ